MLTSPGSVRREGSAPHASAKKPPREDRAEVQVVRRRVAVELRDRLAIVLIGENDLVQIGADRDGIVLEILQPTATFGISLGQGREDVLQGNGDRFHGGRMTQNVCAVFGTVINFES